jgi:ABC-2 type transport system permease protein
MSVIRTVIGVGGAALVAWLMFKYSLFSMGLPLIAFFVNLIVLGWAIGLAVSGMVLRWGLGAEELAWAAIFLLAPISGVYYPISVLPDWLQPVAFAVPASHVFEGMRQVLLQSEFSARLFFNALALNILYMTAGTAIYLAAIRYARERGMLLQMGE